MMEIAGAKTMGCEADVETCLGLRCVRTRVSRLPRIVTPPEKSRQ